MNASRGQTLPLWILGLIAGLALLFGGLNYAYILSWQVKAQNAADAAAQGAAGIQSERWNELNAVLYAASVEEYRIRSLIRDLRIVSHRQGNCSISDGGEDTCASTYLGLRKQYLQSVQRYTNLLVLVNRISTNATKTKILGDIGGFVSLIPTRCGAGPGAWSDCAFKYTVSGSETRSDMKTVKMDALSIIVPRPGVPVDEAEVNDELFAPLKIEVTVCATVPPLIQGINFPFGNFRAIGRAARTTAMVEQDWLQPGAVGNPGLGGASPTDPFFQPDEQYGYVEPDYQWYGVTYGGNDNVAVPAQNGYFFGVFKDEFSAQVGWWNSVPIRQFGTTTEDLACS